MSTQLRRLREAGIRRESAGLRRRLRPRSPDNDGLLDVASNDYLGLSRDPRIVEAATRATRAWGAGATGSRLVTGSTALHEELERGLADLMDAPSALAFSTGYLANLATVTALSGPDTLVVSDAANHASIVDACRLSRARITVTGHRDVPAVEHALAEREEEGAAVVTDAVFSVDGDRAPLAALHDTCRRHDALLIVDEAHALGVVGPGGRGGVPAEGLAGAPDIVRTVTLSKSLGSQGGAVLAAPEVVETLVNAGRSFIFDTGLAPACAGAALAAVEVLGSEPELALRVRERAARLAELASGHGLRSVTPEAAVVPVLLGAPDRAVDAAETCTAHGVRAGCFRPPSVPEGRSCLRLTARATLSDEDLTRVDEALSSVAAGLRT